MKKSGTSKASVRERNQRFLDAYLSNGENATEAYLVIKPHVSRRTAGAEGHKLLKLPEIQAAIEKRRAELRHDARLNTETVVQNFMRTAAFDARWVMDANGKPLPVHKLPDVAAGAVALDIKRNGKGKLVVDKVRTPRASERNSANDKAARMLRLYDAPPPEPPAHQATEDEMKEAARRMIFMLELTARAEKKAP